MLSSPQRRVSTGVFIPVPDELARRFPPKAEDDTPPHFTVAYVGKLSPAEFETVVQVVRKHTRRIQPFKMEMSGFRQFVNEDGQVIPHIQGHADLTIDGRPSHLGELHQVIVDDLEAQGIPVAHSYGPDENGRPRREQFKAHVTLAYLEPGEPYNGPKPSGSWTVHDLEVWGPTEVKVPLASPNHGEF